ncbi:MAG: TRAP transporter small permease [Kiloniellales bacterium]
MRIIDRLSDLVATLAGWAFFAIGLMLAYEVGARYFFNAPTIWAEELSRLAFVWATFIAAASLLHHDKHIRVTVVTDRLGEGGQRVARVLALLFVLFLAVTVVWYGTPIAINSLERGRTTGTMMDLPNWWAQAAVPLSFLLLAVQAVLELIRTLSGAPLPSHEEVAD